MEPKLPNKERRVQIHKDLQEVLVARCEEKGYDLNDMFIFFQLAISFCAREMGVSKQGFNLHMDVMKDVYSKVNDSFEKE